MTYLRSAKIMDHFSKIVALSVGGIVGVNARYWLSVWMTPWIGDKFPWATFTINVSGSFAIGFLAVALTRWQAPTNTKLLLITGLLGGYTTFSAYAFESLTMWERGDRGAAITYVVGSVAAGLLAVVIGAALARTVIVPAKLISERTGDGPSATVKVDRC